jgi:hypothetical protein
MRRQNEPRLKWVLDRVPHGQLVDTPTLERHGVTRQLAHKYVESGWLEPVVRGVYRRPSASDARLEWRTVVRSLQALMQYPTVVGGRTALEEQGFRHYVSRSDEAPVHLYGAAHPSWLKRLPGPATFVLHSDTLFAKGTSDWVETPSPAGPLTCSSPERAVLELLDELPNAESFHIVDTVFEGLAAARPQRLAGLLQRCTSVKVKRLFFVFADRHAHGWRKYLKAEDVNLGSGPRALVAGGKMHPLYKVSVPPEFLPDHAKDDHGA